MSGLLQRLAGQALGAKAASTSRIRSAMSVHAQVPVALPVGNEEPVASGLVPMLRESTPASIRVDSAVVAREDSRAPTYVSTRSAPDHLGAKSTEREAGGRSRTDPSPVPPDTAREARPHEHECAVPERLLEDVAPASTTACPFAISPLPVPSRPHSPPVRGTDSGEPTEVHIHIGRIEVTAAAEPEKPKKPRAATPRQTLPLADYLARRSRA
jgi:hypothetical protein